MPSFERVRDVRAAQALGHARDLEDQLLQRRVRALRAVQADGARALGPHQPHAQRSLPAVAQLLEDEGGEMTYWSWELGWLALAVAARLHGVCTRRVMAVSGRFRVPCDYARSVRR